MDITNTTPTTADVTIPDITIPDVIPVTEECSNTTWMFTIGLFVLAYRFMLPKLMN